MGAGTAGTTVAADAARKGLQVCLVDLKPTALIGLKVCGDAIGKHHFDALKISYPSGEEFEREMRGIAVFSPDQKAVCRVQGKGVSGFVVNRHKFGQRLLKEALDSGVTLLDETRVINPLIRDGCVVGVETERTSTQNKIEIPAAITVDASGYSGVIRSRLPSSFGIESTVENRDLIAAYREIRSGTTWSSDLGEIYLTQHIARGGYYWIFDKGNGKVNVGLGVQMTGGHPDPRQQLYKYVLSKKTLKDSKLEQSGGGIVPTRRPLDCLVSNGVMILGDAACLVNPMHGGGIGPSMLSGKLAAETAVKALEKRDVSKESLWQYNIKYMQSYGAKQGSLQIFRLLLQNLSDDELNFGLNHNLVKEEDVLRIGLTGELDLNITEKVERALKSVSHLGLLIKLQKTAKKMRNVKDLYQKYPSSPNRLDRWKHILNSIYKS